MGLTAGEIVAALDDLSSREPGWHYQHDGKEMLAGVQGTAMLAVLLEHLDWSPDGTVGLGAVLDKERCAIDTTP